MPLNFYELMAFGGKAGARDAFERYVIQLVLADYDGMGVAADPGDWGIDAFVGDLNGEIRIWQAKYFIDGFGKSQRAQVRDSFRAALQAAHAHGHRVTEWTLCIPVEPTADAAKWWTPWRDRMAEEHDVRVDLWTQARIEALGLRERALHITRHYFPNSTGPAAIRRPLVTDRQLGNPSGDARIKALSGSGWFATLGGLYPRYPALEIGGFALPIAVTPAEQSQWGCLECCLGDLKGPRIAPGRGMYSDAYHPSGARLHRLLTSSEDPRRRFDGVTFALQRMEANDGRVTIDCRLGRYFENYATSEALEHELIRALAQHPDREVDPEQLTMRAWLHDNASDPIVDGERRSSALSIATVVIYLDTDGIWSVLVTPRSGEVATHQYLNHVAPSGIFAPLNDYKPAAAAEYSVEASLIREFVEELYANEDLERGKNLHTDVHRLPEVRRLNRLRGSGAASLVYTGLSHNLLTLRTEICTLLLIHDPEWLGRESSPGLTKPLRLGWEYLESHAERELRTGHRWLGRLELDDDFLPEAGDQALSAQAMIPNAAAALLLAAPVAKELVARRA